MGDIDPKRLYSFAEACQLIPSSHRGKPSVCSLTLHNWRRAGAIMAHQIRRRWFVWGAELLKLLPEAPTVEIRSPAQRQRAIRDAEKRARKMGLVD